MTTYSVPEFDPASMQQLMIGLEQVFGVDFSQMMGQFVPEDQQFISLLPQGYSLEFLYPWEIESGVYEMEESGIPFAPGPLDPNLSPDFGFEEQYLPPTADTAGAVMGMRNYSMRDELERYIEVMKQEAGSAEQEALADILWSNNFYTSGVTETEKLSPRNIDSAFKFAVGWGARQGVSVWDMGEGLGRTAAPTLTEATIFYTADKAAQEAFGRNASNEEKQMALTISRALEASGINPSKADIQAELTAGSPDEVDQRAMSSTLRHLMRAIATRGTR